MKFATATLQGRALTWWNGRIASMGIDAANGTLWTEVRKWVTEEFCPRSVLQRLEQELYNLKLKGSDIDGYTNRFHELALLCPRMGEKRKGGGDRGGHGDNRHDYNRRQNLRRANAGTITDTAPVELDTSYEVGLAIGRRKSKLGSFDIIIGMDWLSRYDAAISCGEKKVRIPLEASDTSGPLKIGKYLYFSSCNGTENEEGIWKELQFILVDNSKLDDVYLLNRS
ncbi:putative reverse transcriptase domain-containing protein [Tanacetum coccineum]